MASDNGIAIVDTGVQAALDRLQRFLGGTIRAEVGTNVRYAAIHHFGGKAGRTDKRVEIEARPFMPPLPTGELNETDGTEVIAIMNDLLSRAFEGGESVSGRQAGTEIARYLKTSVQLRFREQKGPDGKAWKPSLRATRTGGQTLRLTSRLRNSITGAAG